MNVCSNMPNNIFVSLTSEVLPVAVCPLPGVSRELHSLGYHLSLFFRGIAILNHGKLIVDVFLAVCVHYVSHYCDHCHYHSLVTFVHSGATLITMMVMLATISVGQTTLVPHDVVLPPQLILRGTMRGSPGLTTMLQQHQSQSQMPSGIFQLCHGSLEVSISFRLETSTDSSCHVLVSVMVFAFCLSSHVATVFTTGGLLDHWVFQHSNPLQYALSWHMCLWPMPGVQ